jgi:hypothetical protein
MHELDYIDDRPPVIDGGDNQERISVGGHGSGRRSVHAKKPRLSRWRLRLRGHTRRASLSHLALTALLSCTLIAVSGCQSCSRHEPGSEAPGAGGTAGGLLPWTFDGSRIMSADGKTPLVEILMDANWAAVTDSEARKTAWLPTPETENAPAQTVEEGHRWVREGIIRGPGADVCETLADKQLIRYKWEVVRQDESSITVTYTASLINHVIFASFSNFKIVLPLHPYLGAEATVDETYGGKILQELRGGLSHPSYWEDPAKSLRLQGRNLALELTMSEGGFTWTSLLDGRALQTPDTSLVIQLYPSVAGPREKLGTLAWKGTTYSASFTLKLSPAPAEPDTPAIHGNAHAAQAPAPLPPAVAAALDSDLWELEPFTPAAEKAGTPSITLGNKALCCDLPVEDEFGEWKLEVDGPGEPRPAFIYVKGPLKDFRLKINGKGDFRDPRDLLDQLGPLPSNPGARADEIYRYAARTTYAMPLNPTNDLGEFLGSYGYGFGSTLSSMVLVRLWEAAELDARRAFVTTAAGHAALAEVYYDGNWHAYDLQDRTYYVNPDDWSVASVADLCSKPDIVRYDSDAGGRSPSGEAADELASADFEGAEVSYNPGSFSFVRLLRTSLVRGEILLRFYRGLGRWAPAPREPYSYSNALLAFCPDLKDEAALEGFSQVENFTIRKGALVPSDPSHPAWFEYRAASPYVIVQSTFQVRCDPSALDGASLLISKDDGKTWISSSLDENGQADLTPLLVPAPPEPGGAYESLERNFGYIVHFELPASSKDSHRPIDEVSILTWSQMNPALSPRLRLGSNEVQARCSSRGPGASLGLCWIETGTVLQPSHISQGEPFILSGEVTNGGKSPAHDFTITAYASGSSSPVRIGQWLPGGPLATGEVRTFQITCQSPDISDLYPDSPAGPLKTTVELRRADQPREPTPWGARTELNIGLEYKPDLVVVPGLVRVSTMTPLPGEQVKVDALVRNFYPTRQFLFPECPTVSSVNVALFERGEESQTLVQKIILGEILPGAGALAHFQWTAPSTPGARTLLVVADPDNEIAERDERNTASCKVTVLASKP